MDYEKAYFERLQARRADAQSILLRPVTAAPSDLSDGVLAVADGTVWNPGNGFGPYMRSGALWLPFWGAWNDGAGSGLDADLHDGYDTGNGSGKIPVSNGTLCTNLNAEKVGGKTVAEVENQIALKKYFESTEQTITSAGALTLAHGLGVEPKLVQVWLICKTAEGGYSIGDKIPIYVIDNSPAEATRGTSIVTDSTNLNIRYSNGVSVYLFINKSTGAGHAINNANWKAIFRAWA